MRKHRHFAVGFAVMLGAGTVAHLSDLSSSVPGAQAPGHHSSPYTAGGPHRARRPGSPMAALALGPRPLSTGPGDPLLLLAMATVPLPPPPTPPPAPRAPAAPPPPPSPPPGASASPDVWLELRQCESGDDYADDTGNGYYGAYQFDLASWEDLGYGGLPSQAPPAVQDQAAERLQAERGWAPWPACARRLGLM